MFLHRKEYDVFCLAFESFRKVIAQWKNLRAIVGERGHSIRGQPSNFGRT